MRSVAMLLSAAALLLCVALLGQLSPAKTWNVQKAPIAGRNIELEKARLISSPGLLNVVWGRKQHRIHIPVSSITGLRYEPLQWNRGKDVLREAASGGDIRALPAMLVLGGVLTGSKGTDHFVTISYTDHFGENAIYLRLRKGDAADVFEELYALTQDRFRLPTAVPGGIKTWDDGEGGTISVHRVVEAEKPAICFPVAANRVHSQICVTSAFAAFGLDVAAARIQWPIDALRASRNRKAEADGFLQLGPKNRWSLRFLSRRGGELKPVKPGAAFTAVHEYFWRTVDDFNGALADFPK